MDDIHTADGQREVVATKSPSLWHETAWSKGKIVRWVMMHGGLLVAFLSWPTWRLQDVLVLGTMLYLTMCLGLAVGMHRGLIHQSYKTSKGFERVLVYLGVLAGIGGPISMARMHRYRDYHQKQPTCPPYFGYGYGFFPSYVMAMFRRYTGPALDEEGTAYVMNDPLYHFLERTFWLHQLLLCALLWACFGWGGVLWGGILRLVMNTNGFWLVSYMSHEHGYITYEIPEQAECGRNNIIFGLLSFGEGWHNNHHAFPHSARAGLKWWELDLSYVSLWLFAKVGLVRELQSPGEGGEH